MQRSVLRAWAADAALFADVLARREPGWGSVVAPFADGIAVLCGPGLYVNVAMCVGLDAEVSGAEFDDFERRCATVGVPPQIEISPSTRADVTTAALERGYVVTPGRSALRRRLDDVDSLPAPDSSSIVIEPAAGRLDEWRATSAAGWGHDSIERRRASDAFAGAASEVDGDGFVIAREVSSGRAVACASVTIRNEVATLGGMSTVPTMRRRGLQAALIDHRLRFAADHGCTIATSTTAPGSTSERNLRRHGFEPWFSIDHLTRSASTPRR